MPKPTKRELELQKQIEELNSQMQGIHKGQRRLSHLTDEAVGGMLQESSFETQTAHQEVAKHMMETRKQQQERHERLLHARSALAASLAEVERHLSNPGHTSFCSCGSNQCGCCGEPPGVQTRGYLCCSSRHYDAFDEALMVDPFQEIRQYTHEDDLASKKLGLEYRVGTRGAVEDT